MNRYLAGAIGGTLATVPMTLAMMKLFQHLPRDEQYPLPPSLVTQGVLEKAGQGYRLTPGQHAGLSLTAHFAYGALFGAVYPLTFHHVKHPVLYGSGYGVAVWAAGYLGWIPAFKVLPPATRQPVNRRRMMIGVHLIWGAGTVLIGEYLARRRDTAHAPEAITDNDTALR
ncbi:hypothetical protein GCM10027040_33490 [Halomonas shantousis]